MVDNKPISLRDYAKLRGVSVEAVSKAIKAGRLKKSVTYVNGKPKISDPSIADKEWQANTDQAKPSATTRKEKPQEATGQNYAQSRAIREGYQARLAKLDYEEKSGKVHGTDECRVAQFNRARKARDMLMSIPDRVSPVLIGMTDAKEIHRLLLEEIRIVCNQLADSASYQS